MKCLVFVPGIMGSALRNDSGSVWPPTIMEFIRGYKRIDDLLEDDLEPTAPISSISGMYDIYGSLIDDIGACGYSEGSSEKRYVPFPYDWRQSNAISAQKLANRLDELYRDTSGDLSITFLAHSMGGLVVRYLLESRLYVEKDWRPKIERLITMGTPHFGAAKALFLLRGTEKYVGLSGPDVKRLANDPRYASSFELVGPKGTAFTVKQASYGDLPEAMDPFDAEIAEHLELNADNIAQARSFWEMLDIARRPESVAYHFIVGSAIKTRIRNEWINSTDEENPISIERKSSGDGTVPIASACVVGITHVFSQKDHTSIFKDRQVRNYLYKYLDAAPNVRPQAADDEVEVGDKETLGISLNQEVYDPDEEIEVVVSFTEEMTDPRINFEVIALDPNTGERDVSISPQLISIGFHGANVNVFSFSIANNFAPGFYQLKSLNKCDDPTPTCFYVREVSE